ncbi:hypothetical protein LDO26_18120 [Luteimonas sp. BDR2-5]|uniref:hypothetical protein n=1 Tax=Proluteimonas luteida TaxID=2878685 RepID=UPI001E28EEE0|nr:hypothetical protein [Luteimonas sp. BDR2-5]MCD9030104.1 hypothetical protein [Luteimonas sp. BDR2-5]
MDEEQHLTLSDRFENTEFIKNSMMVLGVPFDAPEEFKQRVWAAAQSYVAGNRSMDYFYKRYGNDAKFPRPPENRRKLSSTLSQCNFEVERVASQLTNGVERRSYLGLFAAESALLRLSVSFEYASFLLMQGAVYESASVMRLCLEQIAWSYDVYLLDNETLFEKNPTRSVSKIKELDIHAGKLYSLLSNYTHIQPKLQRDYLDFSDKYAAVIFRDFDAALKLSELYARIVNLYVITAEKISYDYFAEAKAWSRNQDGDLVRISDYSCREAMRRWAESISGDA